MKFKIFSKQNIEKYTGDEPYILISIAGRHPDGQHGFAELLDDPNRLDVLKLTFDDISHTVYDKDYPVIDSMKFSDLIYFNESHAKEILEFVDNYKYKIDLNNYKYKIDLICVNCFAGISRSSATAAALSVIMNGNRSDSWIFESSEYYPNSLVYKTIINKWDEDLSYSMTI